MDSDGYVLITVDGRKVKEHRWVMEQSLGRALVAGETVHHRNGVRADNRVENLELWTRPQPPGVRAEDLADWAEEVLRLYRPLVLAA